LGWSTSEARNSALTVPGATGLAAYQRIALSGKIDLAPEPIGALLERQDPTARAGASFFLDQ
jgi:hypothetical protein